MDATPESGRADDPTREAILAAARAAFGSQGVKATSLSQIARAAEVSRPTLYARYPNKARLFVAVLERACESALDGAREAAETPGTFGEVLRRVLIAYYGSFYDSFHNLPRMEALLYAEDTADVVHETRERFGKQLRELIRDQIDAGAIDEARVGMPISRLVELIRLTPQVLKRSSTTREHLRRDLSDFARLIAQALSAEA